MDVCAAITGRRVVEFDYDGHHRVVQPAAAGPHATTGNMVLRGYQIGGTSSSRPVPLWDLFKVDKIRNWAMRSNTFAENPPGYSKGDKHINVICQL